MTIQSRIQDAARLPAERHGSTSLQRPGGSLSSRLQAWREVRAEVQAGRAGLRLVERIHLFPPPVGNRPSQERMP